MGRRTKARECAFQMLYQWEVTEAPMEKVVESFALRDDRQAPAPAEPGPDNKGAEAARAAVAMVHTLRAIAGRPARRRGGRRIR